jgi:hypothetical protein
VNDSCLSCVITGNGFVGDIVKHPSNHLNERQYLLLLRLRLLAILAVSERRYSMGAIIRALDIVSISTSDAAVEA